MAKPPQQLLLVLLTLLLLYTTLPTSLGRDQHGSTTEHHLRPDDPQLSVEHEHYDDYGEHDPEYDRDLVAGSDAEQFKDLDPEEAKERLGQLFDRMDQNSDGQLNRDELKFWIMQSLVHLDMEAGLRKLKAHDTDQDGVVTWPEYVTSVYGYTVDEIENLRKDNSSDTRAFVQSLDEEKFKFDIADLDHDGHLNVTEYAAFEHPHNYQHMAPYEIMHTLRDFDKDNDGYISIQEYLADDKLNKEALAIEREHFKRYDTNNDERLDKQEMIHWVTPGFEKTAHDEVEHLFAETDKDKNDLLSKEEVKAHHEFWVGSQATDYGRHLEDEL